MSDDQQEQVVADREALSSASIEDHVVPCRIEKGLYLGCFGASRNKAALKSENVTHILTVACSLTPAYPSDFVYKIIDVRDNKGTKIAHYFDECFDFIEEAKRIGGGVLIHCFAGRSRSVTIVVAYLMRKYSMSLSESLVYVREKRPMACPNSGFMKLLQNFEKSLQDMGDNQSKESFRSEKGSKEVSNDCLGPCDSTLRVEVNAGYMSPQKGCDSMQMQPSKQLLFETSNCKSDDEISKRGDADAKAQIKESFQIVKKLNLAGQNDNGKVHDGYDGMVSKKAEFVVGKAVSTCAGSSRDLSSPIIHKGDFSFRKRKRKSSAPKRASLP